MSGKRGRGTKQNPASPRRPGWSAAQAAYLGVQVRDELLARYPDNPLVLHLEAGTREDVIGRWVQVYRRAGLRKAEALRRAALQSGHTAPLDKGTTIGALAESVMREAIERQGAALQRAELYVVSPAMHAAVAAAAATVTEDDLTSLTEDDVPAPAGFLMLPAIQMIQQPARPYPDEILALSWLTRTMATAHRPALRVLEVVAWVDGNRPIQVPDFVHGRRLAAQAGHPLPRLMPVQDTRLLLDAPAPDLTHPVVAAIAAQAKAVQPTMNGDGVEVGEHHGETIAALADDWVRAYLFAFVRLCTQQIAITTPYRELRGADQRAAATMAGIMPRRVVARRTPRAPYEVIAAELRDQIESGQLSPGSHLPTVVDLAATYDVSVGTVNRAVAVLRSEELVDVSRGRRAKARARADEANG